MKRPPTNLCEISWPGRDQDKPPIFILTEKGAEHLGDVLHCAGAYGVYYGGVQLRLPFKFAARTGEPTTWFPRTIKGAYKINRPHHGQWPHQQHITLEGTTGMMHNKWSKPRGKRSSNLPVSSVVQVLETCTRTGDYGKIEPETHWNKVRGPNGDRDIYPYMINLDRMCHHPRLVVSICPSWSPIMYNTDTALDEWFQPLADISPLNLTQGQWNLMSLQYWDDRHVSIIPGYHESYFYVGRPGTVFPWHIEDFNIHAVNYQHMGESKI